MLFQFNIYVAGMSCFLPTKCLINRSVNNITFCMLIDFFYLNLLYFLKTLLKCYKISFSVYLIFILWGRYLILCWLLIIQIRVLLQSPGSVFWPKSCCMFYRTVCPLNTHRWQNLNIQILLNYTKGWHLPDKPLTYIWNIYIEFLGTTWKHSPNLANIMHLWNPFFILFSYEYMYDFLS